MRTNTDKDETRKWNIPWTEIIKDTLIGLIIGIIVAIVTVSSQSNYTLRNAVYNIEEQRKIDRTRSLKDDIAILKNVNIELERNMEFMSKNLVFAPVVYFREIDVEKDVESFINERFNDNTGITDNNRNFIREVFEFIKGTASSPLENRQIVDTKIPDRLLFSGGWFNNKRVVTDIDPELIKLIEELCLKIGKINHDISYITNMVDQFVILRIDSVHRIEQAIESIKSNLDTISKSEIQDVKNEIRKEIGRLEKELKKLEKSALITAPATFGHSE
jgi:hypothetical protein